MSVFQGVSRIWGNELKSSKAPVCSNFYSLQKHYINYLLTHSSNIYFWDK